MATPLKELLCGICQEDLLAEDGGAELGELDSCNHRFCFPCISKWAEIENSCPFCKQRFGQLRRKRLAPKAALLGLDSAAELPGVYLDTQAVEQRNQRVVFEDPQFQQWIEQVRCLACGGGDDEDQLLLCDECDRACHTYCAGLHEIPAGEWFCRHCEQRRAPSARRRGRAQPAAARAGAAAGRRRGRQDVVDLLGSEEDSEEDVARPVRRQRTAGAAGRRSRAAAAASLDDDLADFVVPDSGEDSDWLDEFVPARPARAAAPSGRGQAQRAQRTGAGQQRRLRRQRQAAGSGGSDASTHERFGDSEPEAEFTDSQASDAEEGEWQSGSGEEDRPLLARLQRRTRGSHSQAGGGRAGGSRQRRGGGGAAQRAAGRSGRRAAEDAGAPSQAHRNVNALAANWAGLRSGHTSFGELRRSASAGSSRGEPAGPARRRLVRAGALGGGSGAAGGRGGSAAEVVDLLDSPSPAAARYGRTPAARAAGTAAADESLAWQAMEAALGEQEGRRREGARRRGRQQRVVASPAGGDDDESDLDVPLAVRLTREIAAARQRGSQFVSRHPAPVAQQAQQAQQAPHSAGRTVRDMRLMAAAARGGGGTPGSARRPSPLIPRIPSFDGAAQHTRRSSGSGAAPNRSQAYQQQQQQEQALPARNPFTRYQLGGGNDGGSLARSRSAGSSGSRDPPRREGSPEPIYRRTQPASSDFSFAGQPLQQHRAAVLGLAAGPAGPPPQQAQQQQQHWQGAGQGQGQAHWSDAQRAPYAQHAQHAQQQQQQPPRHADVMRQHNGGGWSPSPSFAASPYGSCGYAARDATPTMPLPGSGAARSGSTLADFTFRSARESLPPRSGSWRPESGGPGAGARPQAAGTSASEPSPRQQAQQQQPALHMQAPGPAAAGATSAAPQPAGRSPGHQQQARWHEGWHRPHSEQRRASQAAPPLSKQAILERLKPLLKQAMSEGRLSKETYKLAAKASTAQLFEAQHGPEWRGLSDATAQSAVHAAVEAACNGGLS